MFSKKPQAKPDYEIDAVGPVRVDPLSHWAVQGFAGVLNVLKTQLDGGITWPEQVLTDLSFVSAFAANLVRRSRGEKELPLPGGISQALQKHFPQ